MNENPNKALLDAINGANLWFRAWKTEPVWVKAVGPKDAVETIEGTLSPLTGDVLCRGRNGDTWPQRLESLLRKYRSTNTVDADGWTRYDPLREHLGVLAAKVDHPFSVETERGQLSGKAGDYLVKDHSDSDHAYPEKLWIVDRDLFEESYACEYE